MNEKRWRVSWSVAVVLADWQVSGCCLLAGAMIGCHAPKDDSDGVMEDVDAVFGLFGPQFVAIGSFFFPARPQFAMFLYAAIWNK